MKIEGTVAIVTGGASGIGHAFCVALLENKAKSVIIIDICKDLGEKVQKQFESQYGQGSAKFTLCDVTNKEEMEKVFKQTVADHGKLDILCNNAGIYNEQNWEKSIRINLDAVIIGTYLGMEVMKSGIIVNTASNAGVLPWSLGPVYTAAKHGVVGFTRSIAPVSIEKGIRVNCICPGNVKTDMASQISEEHPEWGKKLKMEVNMVKSDLIAEGLIQLIKDDTKNAEAMAINAQHGIAYYQFTTKEG